MRVNIGKYENYFGTYQLAEVICFWTRNHKDENGFPCRPDYVGNFGEWLAYRSVEPETKEGEVSLLVDSKRHTTFLYRFLNWIQKNNSRKIDIKIDNYDTWSADHTLALIILPMLKQLKETKHGSPWVKDVDVPKDLRSTSAPPKVNTWDTDDNHHKRWDYVLGEMIFAFENIVDNSWEDQFSSGTSNLGFKKLANGMSQMVSGENDTYKLDQKGMKKYQARISKGLVLFGKYYQGLWD